MAVRWNNLRPLSKSEKSIRKCYSESFLLILCTSILILSNGFIINAVDALEHHTGKCWLLFIFCIFLNTYAGDPEILTLFFAALSCLYWILFVQLFFSRLCSRFFVSRLWSIDIYTVFVYRQYVCIKRELLLSKA